MYIEHLSRSLYPNTTNIPAFFTAAQIRDICGESLAIEFCMYSSIKPPLSNGDLAYMLLCQSANLIYKLSLSLKPRNDIPRIPRNKHLRKSKHLSPIRRCLFDDRNDFLDTTFEIVPDGLCLDGGNAYFLIHGCRLCIIVFSEVVV